MQSLCHVCRYIYRNVGETGLSWLPLEFPPNVRIVLSATSASSTDSSSKKSHVIAELERRKWQMVHLKPLGKVRTANVIESFIKKTVQSESSSFAGGAFITNPEEIQQEEAEGNMPGKLIDTYLIIYVGMITLNISTLLCQQGLCSLILM